MSWVFWLFIIPSQVAFAAPVKIPVQPVFDERRMVFDVRSVLQPKTGDSIRVQKGTVTGSGSHIRVRYVSSIALPLTFAPRHKKIASGYDAVDLMYAVLPASSAGDSTVSLLTSPGWRAGKEDAVITFYSLANVPPFIMDMTMEDDSSFFQRTVAYLFHPLRPESFAVTSVHFLSGYKVAGFPLSLFLLVPFVLLVIFLRFRKCWSLEAAVSSAILIMIFLYTARFSIDHVGATIRELREWGSAHTYRDAGELYNVADAVKHETKESSLVSVTVCTDIPSLHDTPLTYLLHPVTVSKMEESWSTAMYGLLFADWADATGVISCHGESRPGEVLKIFKDGSAFVRFFEPKSEPEPQP